MLITVNELLIRNNEVSIHQKQLRTLATEIYKSLTDVNPDFMKSYFPIKEIPYSLRNGSVLKIPPTRSTYYGTNSIHFRACLLWNKLPNTLKESQSLPEFKYKTKTMGKIDCSCTICTNYLTKLFWIRKRHLETIFRGFVSVL